MNPNAGEPVNLGGVAVDPLSNLQNVVDAAKEAAAAQTPKVQFAAQFGSGSDTSPVADDATVPGLIDTALANLGTTPAAEVPELKPKDSAGTPVAQLDPNIKTVDDLLAKGPQVVETVAPAEKTPAGKLKQQIADSVDAFLEEVTGEKVTV